MVQTQWGRRLVPIALGAGMLGTVVAADATLRWKGHTLATVPLRPLYERWRSGLGLP